MRISNCCYAPPLTELYDDLGYCSECHKGAVFEEQEHKVDQKIHNHPLGIGFAQKDKKGDTK